MTPRLCIGAIAVLLVATWSVWPGVRWAAIKARIAKEFPNVKRIDTAELARRLAAKDEPKLVLLDVRTAAEFDVSRLDGARRVDPDAAASSVALPKNAPIVTYCSVGYRSAKFAQRLQEAGFTNVQNLEGSIFQWANEGRPLASERGPASKVHPYNRKWGALLDAPLRADMPDAK